MMNKPEKIDIILPLRIGDCIFTLPALLCLKQLLEADGDRKFDINILSTNKLTNIIKALGLFPVYQYNGFAKIKSWFMPSDKAIFLHTSTQNLGFSAKQTYGQIIAGKKVKYDNNMPYLALSQTQNYLPVSLFKYLKEVHNFPMVVISFFGLCLEAGFSADDIINNFNFNDNSLELKQCVSNYEISTDNYAIMCMEAAYGSKRDSDRRFPPEKYFEISKLIKEKYGLNSVYIGIDDTVKLPTAEHIKDLRKKLSLEDMINVIKSSKCYIGNDTGPLHLVNLMKKPSLAIYAREDGMQNNYYPVFHKINTSVLGIPKPEEVEKLMVSFYF